jgi:hypothetical protein
MELALHRKYKLISESIMWWFTCCLDLLVLLADYLFLANKICLKESRGRHGRDRMVDVLRLHVQSVHISTNVVSWNPAHGEMYSIQHYVIKFASDMQKVDVFFPGNPVSSTNKMAATIFSTIVESGVKHHNLNTKSQIVSFANKIFQLCYKFRCVRFERLIFVNFVGIKTLMGNTLLNKISACRIVFIYTIFAVVILFSATFQWYV